MQTLNLVRPEESQVKYNISRFPDGEVQITLGDFSRKDSIEVKCRVTNAEELFILMQVIDILKRHEMDMYISIYYLMGMRMDRIMDFNRPYTLKVVLDALNLPNDCSLEVFDPHNFNALEKLSGAYTYDGTVSNHVWNLEYPNTRQLYQLVYPDDGAVKRYGYGHPDADVIICKKIREVATGKIKSIEVTNPEAFNGKPLLILDDLCDGGGTFVGIAEAIKKIIPLADLNICVTHMVNPRGIENLSKNFHHVWFSNSYKDWDNLPDNVTMIKVV